ncbi:TR61B protein, partial [Atractosteus spatula]|nr:TR61B protein [Atractosteus spatula]
MWAALGRSWCVRSAAGRASRRWGGGSSEARRPRPFGTAPAGQGGNGDDGGSPGPDASAIRWRPGARRRPLSPLERVSRLLPQDALAQEVVLPGGPPLRPGELVLAEFRRKGRLEFRKIERGRLQCNWGLVPHSEVVGCPSGAFVPSSIGHPLLLRRPSLEEYVLLMRRGPAIAYPKDVSAMLLMMDVGEGDSVLEAGSGSGAMTLFLSRAVGSRGSVLSLEVREDHHRRALLNYQRWRESWGVAREEVWPDNVEFINKDIEAAAPHLEGRSFHSVALDMLNPQVVLPTVLPHLRQGAVCAVYLANITQVVDLLEGVRQSGLPLLCERVIEVTHRDWFLAPAIKKDGSHAPRVFPSRATDHGEEELGSEEESASCDQEEGNR